MDSLFKGAVRSFINMIVKIIGAAIGIVVVLIGIEVILSHSPERHTSTVLHPTHEWKKVSFSASRPTILYVPVVGAIGFNRMNTKHDMLHILQDLQTLDLHPGMLKAIVLYINSPGGVSDDADAIFRMLLEFKRSAQIPVYAYVDGLCASGGYLISLVADSIAATTPSIVGSIGVIMPTAFNFSKTMERLGIDSKTIAAGKSKDELNPFRPWKTDEAKNFQNIVDAYYMRFVNLVVHHRPRLTEEKVREEGANIFTAEKAVEAGYIDRISDSYTETLKDIAQSLEISSDYQVLELRPELTFNDFFGPGTFLKHGVIQHQVRIPGDLPPDTAGKALYLYRPENG